jgi:hypothetical protein
MVSCMVSLKPSGASVKEILYLHTFLFWQWKDWEDLLLKPHGMLPLNIIGVVLPIKLLTFVLQMI